jgi:opacity protein-like surface antigen
MRDFVKRTMKAALAALLVTAAAHPAFAADSGWYAGPFLLGGFTDGDNYERSPSTPLPVTGQTDTSGMSGGGGAWGGYDFGQFSLELAGSYRFRHDQNFTFTDITTTNSFGAKANVQTADFIVSAFYDIPLGWKLQPYVGGGAGVVYHRLDTDMLTTTVTDAGSSSSWDLAWQVGGGLKYPLSDRMNLRLDYRYVDLGQIETSALPTGTNDKLSADITSNDIRLGLTWSF